MKTLKLMLCLVLLAYKPVWSQTIIRRLGKFQEMFAWKQLTYNIDGVIYQRDQFEAPDGVSVDNTRDRAKRQAGSDPLFFDDNDSETERNWNQQSDTNRNRSRFDRPSSWRPWTNRPTTTTFRPNFGSNSNSNFGTSSTTDRPTGSTTSTTIRPEFGSNSGSDFGTSSTTVSPTDENGRFFVQYNNVPMGLERVGDRLFITVPRRRYGIPSTLNYIDLNQEANTFSPALRPYPSLREASSLTSVYRTRADSCGRLWMVDTGLLEIPSERIRSASVVKQPGRGLQLNGSLREVSSLTSVYRTRADSCGRLWMVDTVMLEIPNNPQQVQRPGIVIFDLNTNRQILRYSFKDSDIPAANTPTGLASITVDITNNDCDNAFAYVPELTTFGLIVFSLRDRDSWRLSHNFFSFNPVAGILNINGQRFQWSDGIFSITLAPTRSECKVAYFHPLISTQEFSVSTCVLKNKTASQDSNFWSQFSLLGDRGENSQCTMHDLHPSTGVVFFAEIGRGAVSCWNNGNPLSPTNVVILAQDSQRLGYPSDLHVTGDEVWVMSNSLPRFGYSRLDVNEYNFYIYRGNVMELISGTGCEGYRVGTASRYSDSATGEKQN